MKLSLFLFLRGFKESIIYTKVDVYYNTLYSSTIFYRVWWLVLLFQHTNKKRIIVKKSYIMV